MIHRASADNTHGKVTILIYVHISSLPLAARGSSVSFTGL